MIESPVAGPAGPGQPRLAGGPWLPPKAWLAEGSWRLRRLLLPARLHGDAVLWNLQIASRALWLVLGSLALYALLALVVFPPAPRQLPAAPAAATAAAGAGAAPIAAQKPLSQYLSAIQERNPFTGLAASVAVAVRETKSSRQRLQELAHDLTVVGINRGAEPEALIEDATQHRTVIVKPGDTLSGVTVREINAQGVLLVYEGEELLIK